MEIGDGKLNHAEKKRGRMKKCLKNRRRRMISLSASLPDDVSGAFVDSICIVKYSTDPFSDIRDSIVEMIRAVGVEECWEQMEELVYCYIFLNSPEVLHVIEHAFLSLFS